MTWTPIKIPGPAKPKPNLAEQRAAELAKKRQRAAEAAKPPPQHRALDAFLAPTECPLNGEDEADVSILATMRPRCRQKHGEHACVLAGPVPEGSRGPQHPWTAPAPSRPRHANHHQCACGATWT